MGILHRDISDGNVMMLEQLDEKQKLTRREWKKDTVDLKLDDPELIESEKKLQEVLAKLRRGPTGMLSDFDLHAKHTTGASTQPPNHPTDTTTNSPLKNTKPAVIRSPPSGFTNECDSTVGLPEAKRRTTNSRRSLPVSTSGAQANVSRASTVRHEQPSQLQDRKQGKIDFRTVRSSFAMFYLLELSLN